MPKRVAGDFAAVQVDSRTLDDSTDPSGVGLVGAGLGWEYPVVCFGLVATLHDRA